MPGYSTILAWAGRVVFVALLGVLGLSTIAAVIFFIVPDELSSAWRTSLTGYTRVVVASSEFAGQNDDLSVKDWVRQCVSSGSFAPLPREIEAIISPYGSQAFFKTSGDLVEVIDQNQKAPKATPAFRRPNNQEMNVLQLSRAIRNQRQDLVRTAESAYSSLQVIQLTIIVIGLITTILVSISSTDFGKGDALSAKTIRILAIVFPALGTAAAALNSFYSPRDDWSRANHTLASLAQLHGQIAVGIWSTKCATDASESNDFKVVLTDWGKRYQDILAVGDTSSSSSGSSQGGQPTKGGGGQQGT